MKRKNFRTFGSILLFISVLGFSVAWQSWPVQKEQLIGIYQNPQNPSDTIHLKPNGDYLHFTGSKNYVGLWDSKWEGDITKIYIQFKGEAEFDPPSLVGSRFGQVLTLYLSNKQDLHWRKTPMKFKD